MKKTIIIGMCIILVLVNLVYSAPANGEIYFNFNDNVNDQWNSNDGTLQGDASYSTEYPSFNISGTGSTKSLNLDGTGDYISYDGFGYDMDNSFYYSIWVRPTNIGTNRYIMGFSDDVNNYHSLRINTDGSITIYWKAGGVGGGTNIGGSLSANEWVMLTVVFNATATDCYLYINETKVGTKSDCAVGLDTLAYQDIGQDTFGSSYHIGQMDEFKFYSGLPTTQNIINLYNYGDESHSEANTTFRITAKDEYDTSSITIFNATVNGTFYSTTNGTINTNILTTSTDLIDITVRANNYFNKQYNNRAVSSNLQAQLFQADLTLSGLEKITNNTLTGNYTIDGTPIAGNNIHIKSGTYEITFNKTGYYDKSQNITINALYNGTQNVTGIYNTLLNITVENAYTHNPLENFTGWVYDQTSGYNESYTVTSYKGYVGLLKDRDYTIYATNPSYAIDSELNYKNETWNNTLYNVTFSLYTNNSIRIKIYDENTGLLITGTNISIIVTGNETETTYTTTTGQKFIDNLKDGNYSIKFSGGNYTLKTYTVTVADRSTQELNAYLSTSSATVIFTVRDSDSYSVIEEASITMYKLINGSFVVVEAKNTDITGRAQFTYITGIQYKFFVSKTGYDDKVFYLDPIIFSSYNINLDKDIALEEDQNYLGVNIQFYPTTFYANKTNTFTWLIQSPSGTLTSYNINISYPGGSQTFSGSNSIGEEFNLNFTIPSSVEIDSKVNLTYCYKSSMGTNTRCYDLQYSITGIYSESSLTAIKDNTYGLSLLSRIIIATITVIIVAGLLTFLGNFLIEGVAGLLLLGFLAKIGFIPLWSVLLSLTIGVVFIIWRSD